MTCAVKSMVLSLSQWAALDSGGDASAGRSAAGVKSVLQPLPLVIGSCRGQYIEAAGQVGQCRMAYQELPRRPHQALPLLPGHRGARAAKAVLAAQADLHEHQVFA